MPDASGGVPLYIGVAEQFCKAVARTGSLEEQDVYLYVEIKKLHLHVFDHNIAGDGRLRPGHGIRRRRAGYRAASEDFGTLK